jgi:hypothetical protein
MQSRLDLIAPDVARAIAGVAQPRRIAVLACETALRANHNLPKPVSEAVAVLARGNPGRIGKARLELRAVIQQLDARYLAEYERSGQNTPAVLAAFSRARAANAVLAALDPNPSEAAPEAVYEAHAALPHQEAAAFLDRLRRVLERR